MVPIVGIVESSDSDDPGSRKRQTYLSQHHSERLLQFIANELGPDVLQRDIVDFELELYDTQSATLLGLDSPPSFISAPRMDDKLCTFSAYKSLINVSSDKAFLRSSKDIALVALFDNEEVGSSLRQGAKCNFLETVLRRVVEVFTVRAVQSGDSRSGVPVTNAYSATLARSFLLSADVNNGYNPGFANDGVYAPRMIPTLNKGMSVSQDRNSGMATDAVGMVVARKIGGKVGRPLQLFQNRSDGGGGGTIGPMLSQRLGCQAIDVGMPMLSMHSIRGITGSQDPLIGVEYFEEFLRSWQGMRQDVGFD